MVSKALTFGRAGAVRMCRAIFISEEYMKTVMSAADFRALREVCGVTQQQVAEAMGVRVRAVKRWESGEVKLPQDAIGWMRRAACAHTEDVRVEVEESVREVPDGAAVCLPYYRTQEQVDLAAEAQGVEPGPYQYINAVYRSVGERLIGLGYKVSFRYPDEERPPVV